MARPALVVIDNDTATEEELRKRYGADYDVVAYRSVAEPLAGLPRIGAPVDVVLARLGLADMRSGGLLARIQELHPTAKRALIASWGDEQAREAILEAFALGHIDCHLTRPGPAPDERFHQVVGELLAEWTNATAARHALVRVVGDQSAPRCVEMRDLLQRYSIPFSFFGTESAEGREVLAEAGADASACPIMVLADGRVLSDPTSLEAADALGGDAHLTDEPYDVVVVGAGPRRPGRRRLRGIGGPAHTGRRAGGDRGAGRDDLPHPELPRFSPRSQRKRFGQPGLRAGAALRCPVPRNA
jgi:thioredoxin reductase (NADPH)